MNQLLPQEVVDQIVREERHFSAAPQAFFEAWKRGVEIAGPQWFGDGTREGLNQAKSKWDLRPDMLRLNDALGECRRRSPGPDRDWPRVESREDWCGDFERPDVPGSDGVLARLRQRRPCA